MSVRRSIYADRLNDYADFAFGDEQVFARRGDWRALFFERIGRSYGNRIVLEIGCFNAAYLCAIANKHPDCAFIGLDWKAKSVHDGAKRVAESGLKNVALLRGRAQDLRRIFADCEVDEMWLFHPDPCDRDVELKNRLISELFLVDVHAILRNSTSTLSLKTDHPGYFQWVLSLFGLAEPAWFHAPDAKSPRVRRRDSMTAASLPPPSAAVQRRFDVTMNSTDFWNDPAAIAHTECRHFAGETTLYESRFNKKRQPIYYFEIRKR